MKGIGAGLIVLSSAAFGLELLARQGRHRRMLRALCAALSILAAELETRAEPLPVLCRAMRELTEGSAQTFFTNLAAGMETLGERSFYEIWRSSAEAAFPDLRQKELQELCQLGTLLGRCELSRQLAGIERCRAVLGQALQEAETSSAAARRLALGLPLGLGLLLVLVLI